MAGRLLNWKHIYIYIYIRHFFPVENNQYIQGRIIRLVHALIIQWSKVTSYVTNAYRSALTEADAASAVWLGDNALRSTSYSMSGLINTWMGDCLRAGTSSQILGI